MPMPSRPSRKTLSRSIRTSTSLSTMPVSWAPRMLGPDRSEEHTSELQSLMRSSYAVFCLKKKKKERLNRIKKNTRGNTKNIETHVHKIQNYELYIRIINIQIK